MKTTYFVSGHMRTGTSMMMKCLTAGGLTPAYDRNKNKMNDRLGDEHYQPNSGGFYELSQKDYLEPGFPEKFDGKLVKCMFGGILRIRAWDYKIVFMKRDFEEIRQSWDALCMNTKRPMQISRSSEQYEAKMDHSIGILKQRRDIDLTVLNYRDVVKDPLGTFESLGASGWPIDPEKAAHIVDPELCRFRVEGLTVGI